MAQLIATRIGAGAFVVALAVATPVSLRATEVDGRTRDLLIDKLTQVHLNLAPQDSSRSGVALRLADLLSERARLKAMADLEQGAPLSARADTDRRQALALYQGVVGQLPADTRAKVMSQIGHLYELIGEEARAIETYSGILAGQPQPVARAEASVSLGEVYFKRRAYAQAEKYYQAVLDIPQAASRGLAAYRIAWCRFNQGDLQAAIDGLMRVLRSPELLTRSGAPGVVAVDRQFAEEVSRDLATFFSRRPVTMADIETLFSLSPESAKIANVAYLAAELERIGQAGTSVQAWRFVEQRQAKPTDRLESRVRLAQLEMNLGRRDVALKDFESALGLWASMAGGCEASSCAEMKSRMRKFIIEWNRVEKKSPPAELLATYEAYLKTFPADADMRLWAAQVAVQLGNHDRALYHYGDAIIALSARIASPSGVTAEEIKESKATLEAATLGAVEAAELSKDPAHLDRAYALYLEHSPERKKALEVHYQKAHLIYEKGDHASAAVALREVALSEIAGPASVKAQAADLALDSLVLAKNDVLIESWAREFAVKFPSKSTEFLALARTSIMNQAAAVPQDDAGLNQAWTILARYPAAEATPAERNAYWKNRLIIAEKLGKYGEAREAADALLQGAQVADGDREYALSRKAWLAELVLDFDGALAATEKLPPSAFAQREQRWLKLALYADLAAKDAKPFYENFLKDSKGAAGIDTAGRRTIAARLVRTSATPIKELERQKGAFEGEPETFARLALEIFAKSDGKAEGLDVLRKALKEPGVDKTASGRAAARWLLLTEYQPLGAKFEASQMDASTQKKLSQSLKARLALLEQLEKLAARAVASQDWTAQLVTLDRLARESDRFYQEILALPVPAGLSGEDEQQYLSLLSQQAAPHQVRARDLQSKVAEFWASDTALPLLKSSFENESGVLRALLAKELVWLINAAPEGKKTEIQTIAALPEKLFERPSRESLEAARRAVRENPMSRESVARLLELERQAGREAMAAYLETRLSTLSEVKP